LFTRATLSGGGGDGVQSVSGSMVNNTDPLNPVINSDSTKLDKSVTPLSVYATDGSGNQEMKLISEIGGGSTKEIRTFYPSWNMATLNQWRGWAMNTSTMLTADANIGLGTGTEPNKVGTWFADSNVFLLNGYSKLKKLHFHNRAGIAANNEIQLYIVVADYVVSRGSETNGVVVVNELINIGTGSTLKNDFTIASHTLNTNSVMYLFYRRTGGATNNLQGVQLIFEFE
jgi:hypothetical protein